jgi:hypothetical protein
MEEVAELAGSDVSCGLLEVLPLSGAASIGCVALSTGLKSEFRPHQQNALLDNTG